jgi:phage-related protein
MLIEAGVQGIVYLSEGIAKALPILIPKIIAAIILIIETILDNIDMLVDAGISVIMGLVDGILEALPMLIDKIPVIIDKLIMAIANNLPKLIEAGIMITLQLTAGIIKAIPQLISKIPQIIGSIVKGFATFISKMWGVGKNIVEGIWKGISDGFTWIKNKIQGWVGNVLTFFKKILGIKSPSKEFEIIGKMCVAGFDEGIEPLLDGSEISRSINASVRTIGANTAYGSGQRTGGLNQTININREISTPDEMARAIRLESRYGLMKGVGFA